MQLGFDIRLVKVVQRQLACLVRDGEVRHIAALSDPPQDRLRDDQRLKARRDPRLQLRDLDRIRPVLIIARKIGQQIIEREIPSLCKAAARAGPTPRRSVTGENRSMGPRSFLICCCSPCRARFYANFRRIRTALQILTAKRFYRSHSNAAAIKSGRTVTGGAYRSARKVIMCVRSGYKTGAGLNCTCRMHRT